MLFYLGEKYNFSPVFYGTFNELFIELCIYHKGLISYFSNIKKRI